jgi:hypothetical protein
MNEICCTTPIETIMNKLLEIKASAGENRNVTYTIKGKIFNPEPCNEGKCGVERPDTIESVLDEIRSIVREANNNLYFINDRL